MRHIDTVPTMVRPNLNETPKVARTGGGEVPVLSVRRDKAA